MQAFTGFLTEIEPALRPHHASVIGLLKLRGEMSLSSLAKEIGMSYTGLQPHCERLHKLGFLDRRRSIPQRTGRPILAYQLAAKSDLFFPSEDSETLLELLESSSRLFGQSAPERLLMQCFQKRRESISSKVARGKSVAEKATRLVDERQKQGHLATCGYEAESGFIIREFHHPLGKVLERYPSAVRMELQGMEAMLGNRIERTPDNGCTIYRIKTLGNG